MQIVFVDHRGQKTQGRIAGSGQVGTVPVLIIHGQDRGYIVDAQTKEEFLHRKEVAAC